MSFRNRWTSKESWSDYLDVARITDLGAYPFSNALLSAERFEELLSLGQVCSDENILDLTSFSDSEWTEFTRFVAIFRHEWQSYFVATLYPAFFREVERRK